MRCPPVKGRMGANAVIKADPVANFFLSDKTIRHILEVDAFVLKAAPQPFNKDIIQITAPAIHDVSTLFRTSRLKEPQVSAEQQNFTPKE